MRPPLFCLLNAFLYALGAMGACMPVAGAGGWRFGGHLKYQYTYAEYRRDDLNTLFGDEPANDHELDLRLKAGNRAGPWEAVIHYELLGAAGDSLQTRRRLSAAGLLSAGTATGLPDDRRRLFDLTSEIRGRERVAAVHRLDRFSLSVSGERRVLRLGRQVVSWGNGLVFHPLDFVNPFSPVAIDKEYKTGDDMFYGQWLLEGRDDLQAIVLPRRDPVTRGIKSGESSHAVKYHARRGEVDLDLLAARHFGENLFGAGLARNLGGAVWRLDASYTGINNNDNAFSLVTNLDYSWTWAGRNVYGYAEYFRNGVGESDVGGYAAPSPALSARIARGELFSLARDYAALGLQIEMTPLFNLFNNLIWNLDDGSLFYQLRGVYDWKQDLQLMAGLDLPAGGRGDEYGGVPSPSAAAFAAPGRSAYLRGAWYF